MLTVYAILTLYILFTMFVTIIDQAYQDILGNLRREENLEKLYGGDLRKKYVGDRIYDKFVKIERKIYNYFPKVHIPGLNEEQEEDEKGNSIKNRNGSGTKIVPEGF